MLYEVRIAADTDQEFADTLTKIVEAVRTIPTNGNVFSFARYRDSVVPGLSGLPLSQEAYDIAAKASQAASAPEPSPAVAKRIGRPPKTPALTVKGDYGAGGVDPRSATATIVEGPDGEPAAAMEESLFGTPTPTPPPPMSTPTEKRERAIHLLQSVFSNPAGPPLVRALQNKLKVKKFNEVTDAQCDELLAGAEKLAARIRSMAA